MKEQLQNKLAQLVALEGEKSREQIAGYIVGELIGDYDKKYEELLKTYPSLERIADLASDLEWSNGSKDELEELWQEMCSLIKSLE